MMICYKDMTFCTHYKDCAQADQCHRPLTEDVKQAAKEWWGSDDYPIAIFADTPFCHELKEEESE